MRQIVIIMILMMMYPGSVSGQTEDASAILERSRELTMPDALEATITLTITDKNGSSRVRTNSMVTKKYPDGTEKRLIRFVAPAEVQGTSVLIHDYKDKQDDMWIYLPALKRVRRIVTTEKGKSFMGSEFTNADISSPPASDFINRHLEGSGLGNQYMLESIPVTAEIASEYGFARKVSFFETKSLHLSRMEFYDKGGVLVKTVVVNGIESLGNDGRYMVKSMRAENHLTGRSSSMVMDKINSSVKPPDNLFDVQNLDR
jgi:hypothetical protein